MVQNKKWPKTQIKGGPALIIRKDEQKHQGKQKSKAQNKTNLWKKGQSGPIVQMKWGNTVDPICFTQNFEQLLTKNLW